MKASPRKLMVILNIERIKRVDFAYHLPFEWDPLSDGRDVSSTVYALEDGGYIKLFKDGRIELTERGERYAQRVRERETSEGQC